MKIEEMNSQIGYSIFDSATHPTLDGSWTSNRDGQSFSQLAESVSHFPGYRVLAHGLPSLGNYSHSRHLENCQEFGFVAVAALTTLDSVRISEEIELVASLGYRGINVHPRMLGSNHSLAFLPEVFSACTETGLTCLLCTYEASSPGNLPEKDPFYEICGALNLSPEVKLVLMHGGLSRLLQFSGLARHSSSILLDLSHTIMDRCTKSLRDSIRVLMAELDERICVGSDSPDFQIDAFVDQLRTYLEGLSAEKALNIAYKNLSRLLSIN